MALDENDKIFEQDIEQMLEDMINETFNKEFENIEPFDENMSIEEAETQLELEDTEQSSINDEFSSETTSDEKKTNDNNSNKINISFPVYGNEENTNIKEPSEITFKAGEIKKAKKHDSLNNYISPENIEYADYYDGLEEEIANDNEAVENKEDQSITEENTLEVEKQTVSQKSSNKNNASNSLNNLFQSINLDESLPVNADDFHYLNNNQPKKQKQNNKNKSKLEFIKSNIIAIIIFCIVITGLVISFFDYESIITTYKKTLVYELPTLSFSTFDKDGTTPHNVKLNVSVGVLSSDMKLLDQSECYNIVYNTVSKMDYQYFSSPNAQYQLKKDIKDSLEAQDDDGINYKVYISGIDVGNTNLIGETIDTKSDNENNKKESSEDLLNSMRYNNSHD